MPRVLSIQRWEDFESAFVIGSPDARCFVSLGSGEIQYTSHMDGETVRERVLRQTAGPDFLEIPRASTPEGMKEIEELIAGTADGSARADLERSLAGRLPLVQFNRALGRHKEARRRWAEVRARGIRKRLLAFCRQHDLEVDDDRFREIVAELE